MSSELASKSQIIETQRTEIEQYVVAINAQKQEAETKEAQLEQLNLEVASKEQEIVAKSDEADNLNGLLSSQSIELEDLRTQADKLERELGLLQSKIESDEQYIVDLTRQLEETQENTNLKRMSHYGLAVEDGKGVVFPIEVDIINGGSGAVSVDVSNAQYEAAFQSAVRTAATVASEYTGESISDKNIIVRLMDDHNTDLVKIDGPSAGALITGMIAAGLTDSKINENVLVTGTIEPNGRVGTVGSVTDKTEAARDFGANILLVPESQEFESGSIVVVGVTDIDDIMKYLIESD